MQNIVNIVLIVVIIGGVLFQFFYIQKLRSNTNNYLVESKQEIARYINELKRIRNEEVDAVVDYYEYKLIDPRNIIGDMDFDEFLNWLDLGTIDEVKATREVLKRYKMHEHVKIIDVYIKKNS